MSAHSVISTDHDELLERVLPHVDTGVISKARHLIIQDADWEDEDDDVLLAAEDDDSFNDDSGPDFIPRRHGAGSRLSVSTHRSAHTRTTSTSDFGSDFASAGRHTIALDGLSPPHRPVLFTNFDSGFAEMAEGASPVDEGPPPRHVSNSAVGNGHANGDVYGNGNGHGNGNGSGNLARQQDMLMEPGEAPWKTGSRTGSRASQQAPVTSRTSSPRPRAKDDAVAMHGPVEVPARQSSKDSKHANGYGGVSISAKELVGPGHTRRSSVIVERVDEGKHYGSEDEDDAPPLRQRQGAARSNGRNSPISSREEESSTPPPISHARPVRKIMMDDFENDDVDTYDGVDDGWEDDELGMMPGLAHPVSGAYENGRKPPTSLRNRDKQLNSLISDRMRAASERPANSRTTTLTQNYRDLRTPMLNHVQLYQDAEFRKPLIDRGSMDERPPRQSVSAGKQYRSHDDGLHNGYSGGYGHGHVPATGLAHDPYAHKMSLRRTYSDDELSIRQHSISGRTANSGGPGGGSQTGSMPDFFSASVFQVVLHNPTTAHQLLKFAETRLCAENVEFLARVDEYRTTLNNLASQMAAIHKSFVSPGSASQVNVSQSMLRRAHRDMKAIVNNAFPSMENVFTDLQEQIETMVYQDIYPRFVRHQVALSASRALGSDRFKYQGLGDCFCLTNPNIADNPIVFASDGFVKVTGYTRPEIIPRNCRFLQGGYTDRRPIDRLKVAINERKESVELLLNYKKNGDPFWNLLYVAPLFNSSGKTEFFIGGQVNCSTTIHSNVDVMKVLSQPVTGENPEQENESLKGPAAAAAAAARQQLQPRPSARRTLLRALGVVRQDDPASGLRAPVDTGMEDGVLGRMEGQDLTSQMKEFYSAYSRYLVVRASTFTIQFYSEGLIESLNPAALAGINIDGSDVFRFLGHNMIARQTEYRARVKNAVRAGIPVSTALRLQTRRSAVFRGDEAFVAHWTPLKDENAAVHWLVVTLAPAGV